MKRVDVYKRQGHGTAGNTAGVESDTDKYFWNKPGEHQSNDVARCV